MSKHILITGVNGMLGQNIVKEFMRDTQITGLDLTPSTYHHEDVRVIQQDLTDTDTLHDILHEYKPDAIIHGAAYTNVDRAESQQDLAFKVNSEVPARLAEFSAKLDTPLVHISTDYVFSGENGPYSEEDACDPRGIYSRSKYDGEVAVRRGCENHVILRPNVLYGHGYNLQSSFVDWLISELEEERPVRIVTDQFSNPTYARRLAAVIRVLIEKEAWGTWHFGSQDVISRYDFAREIASVFGLRSDLINAISTGDLNQAAPRPMKCGLICDKIHEKLGVNILSIREELRLLKEEMHVK